MFTFSRAANLVLDFVWELTYAFTIDLSDRGEYNPEKQASIIS